MLLAPVFYKQFVLQIDANDVGADARSIKYPICYYSKKFDSYQQRYSTSEKEELILVLALQHLMDSLYITFISKMKNNGIYASYDGVCFCSNMTCRFTTYMVRIIC